MVSRSARGRRAVLLVANAASPYSRGLRVARSLGAAGWDVEIAAVDDGRHPVDELDAGVRVRRYRPRGIWARWQTDAPRPSGRGLRGRLARWATAAVKLAAWPVHVRGWWAALDTELPPADLYHAFGILAIPVALRLGARARRQGFAGRVVYDVIDVILESNNVAGVPGPVLAAWKWRELRWVRRSDLVVTVNDAIADHLVAAWRLTTRPTVLLNCQPRWTPPATRPDLIRAATGIPPERQIVLFLGRLGRERGLEAAAEAVLRLHDAALVLLGFGAWEDRLRGRDGDDRYAGRHFTLPPVHPDDVPMWTASADASVVAVPANSLNQRLSTPNKFWESITAGVPVVVGRDLEVMRAVTESEGLGAVADPADPDDLARALRAVLEAPEGERAAMRERCLRVTHDRLCWEVAAEPYLAAVGRPEA